MAAKELQVNRSELVESLRELMNDAKHKETSAYCRETKELARAEYKAYRKVLRLL